MPIQIMTKFGENRIRNARVRDRTVQNWLNFENYRVITPMYLVRYSCLSNLTQILCPYPCAWVDVAA